MFLLRDGDYSKYDIKRRHLRILVIPLVLSFTSLIFFFFSFYLSLYFYFFV
jgi:hypothetical protein